MADDEPRNTTYDDTTRHRFEAKFRANERGCWVWQAHCDDDGYGQFKLNGVTERAHRASWILYRGLIEPGMDVDHTCVNRRCVNPEHLEVVTHAENMRRQRNRNKPSWVGVDENGDPEYDRVPTNPELILGWVDELIEATGYKVSGGYIAIASVEGAPWRVYEHDFEQGLIDRTGGDFPLAALYLYVVSLGVNWMLAARRVLKMNPLSLRHWNRNPEWKADIEQARKAMLSQKWKDSEESMLDIAERKAPGWEGKDVVNLLKVIDSRSGRKQTQKKAAQQGLLPAGNRPIFNFIFPEGITPAQIAAGAARVMEGTIRDVTDEETVPDLPPPEDWEEQFDDED